VYIAALLAGMFALRFFPDALPEWLKTAVYLELIGVAVAFYVAYRRDCREAELERETMLRERELNPLKYGHRPTTRFGGEEDPERDMTRRPEIR
jgi:hypothetical protein